MVAEDDDELEEHGFFSTHVLVRVTALVLALGLLGGWYAKQMERQRTGKHKKSDE